MSLPLLAAGEAQATKPPEDQPAAPSAQPDIMIVKGRLSIQPPKEPLRLGEENAIRVILRGPAVRQIMASQSQDDGYGHDVEVEGSEQLLVPQHTADGGSWVNVVPVVLGPVKITLVTAFADGGLENESSSAEVIARRPPEKLTVELAGGINSSRIAMDLSKEWRKRQVFLQATWPGVARPLTIPAKDLQFKVTFDKGDQAIRFHTTTGEINALRLGDALIEASYGGLTQSICVQVREGVDFGGFPQCKELEKGGDRVLPTGDFGDAPGADSKLPYTANDGRRGRFIADDRVEIASLAHPLNVAEENTVELKVRGPAVARIECEADGGCVPRNGYDKPPAAFAFEQKPAGVVSANIFPSKIGHVDFSFLILFTDGGAALKTIHADVGFGSEKPRAIATSCGNDSVPDQNLPLRLSVGSSKTDLWTNACYDGVPGFVILPASEVAYRIESEDGAVSPIQVNEKTGAITALQSGQALLEREFRGAHRTTCVVVVPKEQFNDPDVSNCRDLRNKYGAPLPPLPPAPKLPKMLGPAAASAAGSLLREQAINRATLSPDVKDPFTADDRLQVATNGVSALPGEATMLPLRLQGPEVLAVSMTQSLTRYFGASHAPVTYEETQWNPLTHDANGTPALKIVPLRVGTAQFSVKVLFADGGVATERFEVPVKLPPDRSPRLFNAIEEEWHNSMPVIPASTLHLLMTAPDNTRTLFPYVVWEQNGVPIALNPRDVAFSLKDGGETPVVRLDKETGTMTALRIGHALVTMRYAGAQSETCVEVLRDLTTGDSSDCGDLRTH